MSSHKIGHHRNYTLIFTLLIFAQIISWAKINATIVEKETARMAAKHFLNSQTVICVGSGSSTLVKGVKNTSPAYYIFNDYVKGQWVIISGESCAMPVLAHGNGNLNINNMPENMTSYLNGIERNILLARAMEVSADNHIATAWKNLETFLTLDTEEKILYTPHWNQGEPYNIFCPYIAAEKKRAVTGCVATAMSMYIRYCRWPKEGKGIIPAYTTAISKIPIPEYNLNGYQYDYDAMPLSGDTNKWTEANKNAVAKLIAHCGAMVKVNYDTSQSGAATTAILPALTKYMSYSKQARLIPRSSYSGNEWLKLIKAQIDDGYPVLMVENHAFLCDGYNNKDEIHINWGWSGEYDGWFAVTYLNPYIHYFSYTDCGIFDLRPATAQEDLELTPFLRVNGNGISLVSGTIAKGSPFVLNAGSIQNVQGTGAYFGKAKFALMSNNGELKEFISNEFKLENIPTNLKISPGNISCSISSDVAFGDYITLFYTIADGSFTQMGAYNSLINKVVTVGNIGVYDVTMICDSSTSHKNGQKFYPSLIFGHKRPIAVEWFYDNNPISVKEDFVTLTAGNHTIKAVVTYSDNSIETILKPLVVNLTLQN